MFSPEDGHRLQAARGWLELGDKNYREANEELENISPQMRGHPEVLKLRIAIYLAAGKKKEAAIIADGLSRIYESG